MFKWQISLDPDDKQKVSEDQLLQVEHKFLSQILIHRLDKVCSNTFEQRISDQLGYLQSF